MHESKPDRFYATGLSLSVFALVAAAIFIIGTLSNRLGLWRLPSDTGMDFLTYTSFFFSIVCSILSIIFSLKTSKEIKSKPEHNMAISILLIIFLIVLYRRILLFEPTKIDGVGGILVAATLCLSFIIGSIIAFIVSALTFFIGLKFLQEKTISIMEKAQKIFVFAVIPFIFLLGLFLIRFFKGYL